MFKVSDHNMFGCPLPEQEKFDACAMLRLLDLILETVWPGQRMSPLLNCGMPKHVTLRLPSCICCLPCWSHRRKSTLRQLLLHRSQSLQKLEVRVFKVRTALHSPSHSSISGRSIATARNLHSPGRLECEPAKTTSLPSLLHWVRVMPCTASCHVFTDGLHLGSFLLHAIHQAFLLLVHAFAVPEAVTERHMFGKRNRLRKRWKINRFRNFKKVSFITAEGKGERISKLLASSGTDAGWNFAGCKYWQCSSEALLPPCVFSPLIWPATSAIGSHDLHRDPGSASFVILSAEALRVAVPEDCLQLVKDYLTGLHAWNKALPMELPLGSSPPARPQSSEHSFLAQSSHF